METLHFAIDGAPPTSDQIRAERSRAADLAKIASRRERKLSMAIKMMALVGLTTGLAMVWLPGLFAMDALAVGIARAVAVSLLAFASGLFVSWTTARVPAKSAWSILGLGCPVTLALNTAGAFAITGFGNAFNEDLFATMLGVGLFLGTFGLGIVGAWFEHKILAPEREAQLLALDVMELNDRDSPESCVKFMELVDSSDEIRAYHEQLLALGRMPVMAELEAAQDWAITATVRSEQRRLRDQARQSAERMQGTPAAHPSGA